MVETKRSTDMAQALTKAVVAGDIPVRTAVQQCRAAGLSVAALRSALIAVEREIIDLVAGQRPGVKAKAVADRLSAALGELDLADRREAEEPSQAPGTVAIAGLPGDGHHVGRELWQTLLTMEGYTVHDLGLRAPTIVAREIASLKPDAVALNLFDRRSRRGVEALVANLLRQKAQIPLLIGGGGVDEAFAQWLAIAESSGPYWGGVYYCADGLEMLQVLQQIVLFEPPPMAHSHDHDARSSSEEACESCGGCPLVGACDSPLT